MAHTAVPCRCQRGSFDLSGLPQTSPCAVPSDHLPAETHPFPEGDLGHLGLFTSPRWKE